jgi:Pretoxin HINT domain
MAPIGGQAASVGKLTVKYGDEAVSVLKHADDVVPAISKSGDAAAAAIKGCSFTADTLVATADGAIAIGKILTGTQVLAWDEASGTTGSFTVTAVLVHPDPVLLHLTLDGERITTTPEHPKDAAGSRRVSCGWASGCGRWMADSAWCRRWRLKLGRR